jgi:Peptidase family M1 domain
MPPRDHIPPPSVNRRLPICWFLVFSVLTARAGSVTAEPGYDAHAAFAPNFYPFPGNVTRGANGAPGPGYWQNTADYQVAATLNTNRCTITGQVIIRYTNQSPDNLPFLWLELDQNIDRADSRANRRTHPGRSPTPGFGFHFQTVERFRHGKWLSADYWVSGTRMQIRLARPLRAHGGTLRLRIRYDYPLLASSEGGRSGILPTRNGRIFEVSYWYPRMCVYDDAHGWNTLPFLGQGEFYLDYGDVDYRVTLPRGLIVAGAGTLMNPRAVLTAAELRRLQEAQRSDRTILIHRPKPLNEPASRRPSPGEVTWHFHMSHTRDVAWAASRAFVWDAARINLPAGRRALAMSFYPVESQATNSWGRATEYLKNSVEIFSRAWFAYPYPTAVEVAGSVGGMEFPGLTFDGWKDRNKSLWALLSHEIGHTWFPMVVGSDERRNAWMDEGFNTFVDIYASQEFNHGEYAPKRDGEYAPHGGNPAAEIVPVMRTPGIPPIMSLADSFRGRDLHPVEYFKTAFGLVLLREVLLGHQRFDYAFRQYIAEWAFKHPTPWDFFRTMDNAAGEDLSWFWRGWFEHDWQLDQAVKGVKYVKDDPHRGAEITIANRRRLPMPVLAEVTENNGRKRRLHLPVEIWEDGAIQTFHVDTTRKLLSVVLDPDHVLPDIDRTNNVWKADP